MIQKKEGYEAIIRAKRVARAEVSGIDAAIRKVMALSERAKEQKPESATDSCEENSDQ